MFNSGKKRFRSEDAFGEYDEEKPRRPVKKILRSVLIGSLSVSLLYGSFFTVDTSEKAVVLRMGQLDRIVGEGLNFKLPLVEKAIKLDIRIAKITVDTAAASKDLQTIKSTVVLNYHLNSAETSIAKIYTTLGINYTDKIIEPSIHELVKAAMAKYSAEQLVTSRENVKENIKVELVKKLSDYGIVVDDVSMTNFEFSKEFDAAVEQKLVAEQSALKAKQDLERIKIEAEQKIATAQAEAASLKAQKQEITPELIELRKVEAYREWVAKWNGVQPTTVLGGQAVPMLNLGK